MITIAVCDDNALIVESTASMVASVLKAENIAHSISKFTSGRQLLQTSAFDILFLDIEMEFLDGLETARTLRARGDTSAIIFLTAHRQYVFSAFDVEAAHYLLKPPDKEKLEEILMRIVHKLEPDDDQFLLVRKGAETRRIALQNIFYIEVLGRKIFLHTSCGVFDFNGRLAQLEASLPPSFYRCHRSFLVNLSHVRQYRKTEALLEDGTCVPIAKRKVPSFGKEFLLFLRQDGECQ